MNEKSMILMKNIDFTLENIGPATHVTKPSYIKLFFPLKIDGPTSKRLKTPLCKVARGVYGRKVVPMILVL